MNYIVRIANKTYAVEVEDVHARPIIARVDGECFEVHPDSVDNVVHQNKAKAAASRDVQPPVVPEIVAPASAANGNELTAPLPGTVVEVFIKNGDDIDAGHVVLVIEAMKMKNSIRAIHAGKVAEVLVSAGQTVAHKQPLVRFE